MIQSDKKHFFNGLSGKDGKEHCEKKTVVPFKAYLVAEESSHHSK
jgi:hypothetical protein